MAANRRDRSGANSTPACASIAMPERSGATGQVGGLST